MKIGEPTTELPTVVQGSRQRHYETKYSAIRRMAQDARGAWIPVACEDAHEAHQVINALRRDGAYQVSRRGLVVYLRFRQNAGSPPP